MTPTITTSSQRLSSSKTICEDGKSQEVYGADHGIFIRLLHLKERLQSTLCHPVYWLLAAFQGPRLCPQTCHVTAWGFIGKPQMILEETIFIRMFQNLSLLYHCWHTWATQLMCSAFRNWLGGNELVRNMRTNLLLFGLNRRRRHIRCKFIHVFSPTNPITPLRRECRQLVLKKIIISDKSSVVASSRR